MKTKQKLRKRSTKGRETKQNKKVNSWLQMICFGRKVRVLKREDTKQGMVVSWAERKCRSVYLSAYMCIC